MNRKRIFLCLVVIVFFGCSVKIPKGLEPVENFELERYLGKWYELARLDHSFERGMTDVTAEYSMRKDGGVKVLNRGYKLDKKKWVDAEGKAYFVKDESTGFLKVSFWGPFYGAYVIFRLDSENYNYALVSGPDKKYLWLLSRTPTLSEATKDHLVSFAKSRGFETDGLYYVTHNRRNDVKQNSISSDK